MINRITQSARLTGLLELAVFIALALGLKEIMDPFFWRYSGPVSLITTIILITLYIRARHQSWSSMGLRALPGVKAKLLVIPQALLVFASVLAVMVSLTKGLDAIGITILSDPIAGEQERWGDISGNLEQYLILLGISWISAGFAEEMFFRGFVLTRLTTIFGSAKPALAFSVFLAAAFFGFVHFYYQGLAGFLNAAVIGLILGFWFLIYKRNLWPLIIAHGSMNSLGFTMEYLGFAG
jgi:membrane protease YdiL (CAAX protease family)